MQPLDSPTARNAHAPRAIRDFAKMVAAAVAVGVTASAAAVGATLLLTRSAAADASAAAWTESHAGGLLVLRDELVSDASEQALPMIVNLSQTHASSATSLGEAADQDAIDTYDEFIAPMPGNMYIGGGCESEPIYASERDWHVVIEGTLARITVMQSFVMPDALPLAELPSAGKDGQSHEFDDGDEEMGRSVPTWFHTVLPSGAKLLNLFIENDSGERAVDLVRLTGDWRADDAIMATADEALLQSDATRPLRGFARPVGRLLTLATDEIAGYAAGEAIIVRYEYQVQIDEIDGVRGIDLPLAPKTPPAFAEIEVERGTEQRIESDAASSDTRGYTDAATPGAVWIEWRSAQPTTLLQRPLGVSVERMPSNVPGAGRIAGAAWAAPAIAMDDEFRLRWK